MQKLIRDRIAKDHDPLLCKAPNDANQIFIL
jgi:hypothetical protein